MESTHQQAAREPLEREHERFARLRTIEILTRRARLAQARLQLDELTGELTPAARDVLRHDLVTFTEQAQALQAAGR